MNQLTPDFLARSREVFKNTWPSLENARESVLATAQSPLRRDTLSAFETLKRRFKVDLAVTPATWPVLRQIFAN